MPSADSSGSSQEDTASATAEASEPPLPSAAHLHRSRWDAMHAGGGSGGAGGGGGGSSPAALTGKGFGTLAGDAGDELAGGPALTPSQALAVGGMGVGMGTGTRWYGSLSERVEGSGGQSRGGGGSAVAASTSVEGPSDIAPSRDFQQDGGAADAAATAAASATGPDRPLDWGEIRERDGGGHSGSFRGIGTGSVRDGRGGRDAPVEDTQSDGGDDRGDPEARHGRDRGRSRDRDGEPSHVSRGGDLRERSVSDLSGRVGSGGGGGSGPGGMFPIRFDSRNGGAYRIPDGVGMGGMGGRVGRRGPMSGTRWTGGMRGGGGPGLGRGGRWMGGGGGVGGRGGNFVGFQNYADLAVRPGGFGGGGRGGVGGNPGPGGMGGGGFGGGVIGGRGYAELAASRGSDERRRNSGDDERRRGSGFGGGSGSGDEDDRRRRSHSGGSATSGRRSSGLSINGRSSPSPGAGSDRAGGRGNKSPFGSHDLEGDGVGEHGRRVVGWGERDRDRERRGDRDRYLFIYFVKIAIIRYEGLVITSYLISMLACRSTTTYYSSSVI